MNNFNKLSVSSDRYFELRDIQIKNGSNIQEQIIGSRKKLFSHGILLCTTAASSQLDLKGLSTQKFASFLGMFSRNLYGQFHKNQLLFDQKIEFSGFSRAKNKASYNQVKRGYLMYYVDLSSAYWQIAHRLGYLPESIFKKYMFLDDYKAAKRFCISFLARRNSKQYTSNSGEKFIVKCEINVLNQVYINIRNELYGIIQKSISHVPNWIEYNIDGVLVPASSLAEIEKFFKDQNLHYKITECQKLNENEFRYGTTIRKF